MPYNLDTECAWQRTSQMSWVTADTLMDDTRWARDWCVDHLDCTYCVPPATVRALCVTQAEVTNFCGWCCPKNRTTGMAIVFEEARVSDFLFKKCRICPEPNVKPYKCNNRVNKQEKSDKFDKQTNNLLFHRQMNHKKINQRTTSMALKVKNAISVAWECQTGQNMS